MSSGRQSGQALVEAVLVGLLLMVPLVWTLGVLAEVHRSALAVTAAAREAGFGAARSSTPADVQAALEHAVRQSFADHGLDPDDARVQWAADGLRRGTPVTVEVAVPVPVIGLPLLGGIEATSIWVRARHVARVDPFGNRP